MGQTVAKQLTNAEPLKGTSQTLSALRMLSSTETTLGCWKEKNLRPVRRHLPASYLAEENSL